MIAGLLIKLLVILLIGGVAVFLFFYWLNNRDLHHETRGYEDDFDAGKEMSYWRFEGHDPDDDLDHEKSLSSYRVDTKAKQNKPPK